MISPCPFCGGTGKVSVSKSEVTEDRFGKQKASFNFKVSCNSCKARGPIVSRKITIVTERFEDIAEYQRGYNSAVEKWNNRKGLNQYD